MAITSLAVDVDGGSAADIAAWLGGVSDVASAIARRLRAAGVAGYADLSGAVERVAEEAYAAEQRADEIVRL